jgi:hypothetical protein
VRIYTPTYCNKGHLLEDGRPVDHECHVLPPEMLAAEREDDFARAIELLGEAQPLRAHRGVKGVLK